MRDVVERRKLTPPQIAAQFGINSDKVVHWINTGELRAVNIATRPNGRPRWVVDIDDLAEFEQSRAAVPPTPKPKRRKRAEAGVIQFFK